MLQTAAILAIVVRCIVVFEVAASTVPCLMDAIPHSDNGEIVWEVMYTDEGYGTERNCRYLLEPNKQNREILYVEFRELYLVSKSGTCSALFEINGEHFCHVPYQHHCFMFRLTDDDTSCQQFENPFYCEARIWHAFPLSVSVTSKSISHDQRRVQFIYQYSNCSQATSTLTGRRRTIEVQWSTWPEIDETTSPTEPASNFESMTITIPVLILLAVILAVLLSVILARKCSTEKSNGDGSSHEVRKQSGSSLTAREYGTIENEYENVEKPKARENDEKEVVYNAIYETRT